MKLFYLLLLFSCGRSPSVNLGGFVDLPLKEDSEDNSTVLIQREVVIEEKNTNFQSVELNVFFSLSVSFDEARGNIILVKGNKKLNEVTNTSVIPIVIEDIDSLNFSIKPLVPLITNSEYTLFVNSDLSGLDPSARIKKKVFRTSGSGELKVISHLPEDLSTDINFNPNIEIILNKSIQSSYLQGNLFLYKGRINSLEDVKAENILAISPVIQEKKISLTISSLLPSTLYSVIFNTKLNKSDAKFEDLYIFSFTTKNTSEVITFSFLQEGSEIDKDKPIRIFMSKDVDIKKLKENIKILNKTTGETIQYEIKKSTTEIEIKPNWKKGDQVIVGVNTFLTGLIRPQDANLTKEFKVNGGLSVRISPSSGFINAKDDLTISLSKEINLELFKENVVVQMIISSSFTPEVEGNWIKDGNSYKFNSGPFMPESNYIVYFNKNLNGLSSLTTALATNYSLFQINLGLYVIPCSYLGIENREKIHIIDNKMYALTLDTQDLNAQFTLLEKEKYYQTSDGKSCFFKIGTVNGIDTIIDEFSL